MTLDQFLQELGAHRNQFHWSLEPDTRKALDNRAKPRLHIRASCAHKESPKFDVIGAVCYVRTGNAYPPQRWAEAALMMGMAIDLAEDLINAANDQTWADQHGKREPDQRLQSLRARLMQIVWIEHPVTQR